MVEEEEEKADTVVVSLRFSEVFGPGNNSSQCGGVVNENGRGGILCGISLGQKVEEMSDFLNRVISSHTGLELRHSK